MKCKSTFSIIFFLRRKSNETGKNHIYARITVNGTRSEFTTKQYVSEEHWDKVKGFAYPKSDELKSLNFILQSIHAKLLSNYNSFMINNIQVSAESLRNRFLGIEDVNEKEKVKRYTLLEVFDIHNVEIKNTLEWGTLKNYFTTKRYFQTFIETVLKQKDIELHELNYRFITSFESFMRKDNTSFDSQRPCENNTIMKHIERFRKIINMALKNEWMERDPFLQFKPKFIPNEREFLSAEELSRIESKHFSIPRLEQVKDLFVFSCYTGLAYIDSFNLDTSNLAIGINGKYWITTSRQKTSQAVRIPLLPKAQEIIDKYKDDPKLKKQNRILPAFTNQCLNSFLKEIADCCRITKPLTFHIARHTFATTVTLTNGVPIETVSKLLGHTSIRTTQIYAKVVETKVMNDMDLLSEKLNNKELNRMKKVR